MNIYEQIISRWKFQALQRNPAASLQALDLFEEKYKIKLPAALRRVLLLSNGIANGEYDQVNQIRFWALEEFASVEEWAPELTQGYRNNIVFADYSVNAHAYAFSTISGAVVLVGAVDPVFVTGSVESFLMLYVQDAPALFPREGPHRD